MSNKEAWKESMEAAAARNQLVCGVPVLRPQTRKIQTVQETVIFLFTLLHFNCSFTPTTPTNYVESVSLSRQTAAVGSTL